MSKIIVEKCLKHDEVKEAVGRTTQDDNISQDDDEEDEMTRILNLME